MLKGPAYNYNFEAVCSLMLLKTILAVSIDNSCPYIQLTNLDPLELSSGRDWLNRVETLSMIHLFSTFQP